MRYTHTECYGGRSESYRFTVDSRDDENLKALKASIKTGNVLAKEFGYRELRVVLAGRGPRKEAGLKDYDWKNAYQSWLPVRYATSFDVYVYEKKPRRKYNERYV